MLKTGRSGRPTKDFLQSVATLCSQAALQTFAADAMFQEAAKVV